MSIFEELRQKAQAQQQNYYELSSDWNVFKKEEQIHLYNYIGYALYGPPEPPKDEKSIESNEKVSEYIYQADEAKRILLLFKKIIECGTPKKTKKTPFNDEPNRKTYCVVLYNVIFADEEKISKFEQNKQKLTEKTTNSVENSFEAITQNIISVVIFKFKALKDGKESCWFMDSDGRIYKHWNDYIENNKLPKCTMVLPKDGKYRADPSVEYSEEKTSVFIECHQSPACHQNKLVSRLETAVLLGSVGATGVAGVAAFTTVAPVALTAAVVTGAASGVWGIGKSLVNLIDRSKHEQSLASKEAAGDWLTISTSTFGILSIGASKMLSKGIEKGIEISKTGRIVHDSITGGSLIMSGVSVTYRTFDMYKKKSKIEKSDIFFLVTEIFFLCNSIVNMKLAKNIIETRETQILDEYQNSLRSNRHRKAFKKLTKGADSSTEIIREINKIDQKDEFFAALVRSRKTINPKEFSKLTLKERVTLISDFVPANGATNSFSNTLKTFFLKTNEQCLSNLNSQKFVPICNDIKKFLSENADVILMELLKLGFEMLKNLSQNDTTGEFLASIVDFLWIRIKSEILRLMSGIDEKSIQAIIHLCVLPLFNEIDNLVSDWQDYLRLKYHRKFLGKYSNSQSDCLGTFSSKILKY